MISYWSALYIIPLVFIAGIIVGKKKWDYAIIVSASAVAYIFTRVISEYITDDRYYYDLANDFMVMAVMIGFVGIKRPIVIALMSTYAAMIYFSYIPYSEGLIDKQGNFITLEIIGKIQLIILLLGVYHDGIRTYCSNLIKRNKLVRSSIRVCYKIPFVAIILRSRYPDWQSALGHRTATENMDLYTDGARVEERIEYKPTYGIGPGDFWGPVR